MVAGFMAASNVAVTTTSGHIPRAASGGDTEITVGGGGGTHAAAEVVKVHTKLLASALPATSWAPVVMVAVKAVLRASVLVGVKTNIWLGTSWVMVPATGVTPGPVSVKVAGLMVAGFIACGKVAATTVLEHVPLEPLAGFTELGGDGGWHRVAAVVKVHTKSLARGCPRRSSAPVVIVAV
jgi:hypothetical protein